MDQLRQVLNTIQSQLTRLNASQKLLIGSLAVVMAMTLFLVTQYAGGEKTVELLPGAAPERQQQAIELLQINGIEHTTRDGRVYVPMRSKHFALAQLSQRGALPDDSSLLFSNIVDKQSWAMSADQRRQMERLALQNELAMTISQFDGIRSAKVLIDVPDPVGLGATARRPTASATVFTSDGRPISQRTVDSVAALVAGARAGLSIEDVRVIDGSNNIQRRPTGDDEVLASTNFEHTLKVEKTVRDKLLNMLAYIDGVIVAVNAQVDTRRISTDTRRIFPNNAGSQTFALSESIREETQASAARGGEPGARSNVGLDIARGGGGGESFTRSESEAELRPEVGYEQQRVIDPRGVITKLNATINIPRSYFIARYKDIHGADAEPSDDDLQPVIDGELERIRSDVHPQVDRSDELVAATSEVVVSMIPDWSFTPEPPQSAGIGVFGIPGGTVAATNLLRTVGLGALALLSLGLMARTLKKASKPIDLPDPDELMGVPTVAPDADMVGEAGEEETTLTGIELSDEDINRRKMLEQVTELISTQPEDAARLVNKWIDRHHS